MVNIPPLPHGAWPDLAPELVASERHEGFDCGMAKLIQEKKQRKQNTRFCQMIGDFLGRV
jgi:hypothetical protein